MSQSDEPLTGKPLLSALLIGIVYGILFGWFASFSWLIGIPAVFMAVTVVGELTHLFKQMGSSMTQFWLAILLGAMVADFLIIMLPLAIVTLQSDLEGSMVESMQIVWKFYLLSLNSVGSNLIITITAALGLLGFIGIYRRLNGK